MTYRPSWSKLSATSREWLEEHAVSPEVANVRGYCRYRKNDRGGLLREAWPEDNTDFVTTKVTPVCGGLIIPRYPPPSLMLSRVYAEIRPDKAVVLDNRDPDGAKYVFPKGSKYAKRIDMHPLAVGLLRDAKRIYFGLEGCIKADAMLSAILRSREKASVLSVPSVTLWPIGPERTSWTSTCLPNFSVWPKPSSRGEK